MTVSSVTAFCPGHISGYFMPVLTDSPQTSGSCGAGIVIDKGVTVTVYPAAESRILVSRKDISDSAPVLVSDTSPVISSLLEEMGVTALVKTCSSLPLSAGYGLSAAAILATSLAVCRLYDLSFSDKDCTALAHRIEVQFRTGLGDVAACQGYGWVEREGPGIDAIITRHPDDRPVFALSFGPLKTFSVLSSPSMMKRIRDAFPLHRPETIEDLFRLSRSFAEKSGLISDAIQKVLIDCDANHIPASMTMLGNGVFALGDAAYAVLSRHGEVFTLHIEKSGPRIVEVRA